MVSIKYIYNNIWITAIMLLFLIRPAYVQHTFFAMFFNLGMYITCIFVFLLYFFSCKYKSKSSILIIIFFGVTLVSTLINGGDIVEAIKQNFPLLSACIFFEVWLSNSPATLLKAHFVFEILTYINLATILIYPEGLYSSENYTSNWFLGFNNIHIRTILPGICLSFIYGYKKYKRFTFRSILLLIVTFITVFTIDSSTSITGVVIFTVLLVILTILNYKKILMFINLYTGMLIIFIVNLLVVFQIRLNILSYIIENILYKDLTMTGRTLIWSKSIQLILKKPFWGYGFLIESEFQGLLNNRLATHPHNFILHNLTIGGIFSLIIFIIILLIAARELNKSSSVCSKVVLCTILSFMCMGISESLVGTKMLWPMFILGANIDSIDRCSINYKIISVRFNHVKLGQFLS